MEIITQNIGYKKHLFKKIFNDNYLFIGILVLLFFGIGLINILNHELWRDEIEAWLIAKESTSITNLFKNFDLEGHPCLWYLCLYLISRFTDNIFAMQIFHLILATGAILIFVRFSTFTKLQKILLVFSYFLFYEYATISRNYAIGILLIFVICWLFQKRTKTYLPLSILLFFLCQTNVFGLIIAILFGFSLVFEYATDQNLRESFSIKKWKIIISILIFIIGISSSILQMLPPVDSVHVVGWNTNLNQWMFLRTFKTIWYSYFPVPKIDYRFWGTNILNSGFLQVNLAAILIFCICLFFIRKPVVFYVYSLGTFGILAFFYLKHYGALRHHGHLFILLIVCFWIARYYPNIELTSRLLSKVTKFFIKIRPAFITLLFFFHFIAGIIAISYDWKYPFSASREVVKYIQEQNLDHFTIAGDIDYVTQFVSAYFNKKIYYPGSNRFGSFPIWDKICSKYQLIDEEKNEVYFQNVLANLKKFSQERGEDILLILNYPLDTSHPFIQLKSFNHSIVTNETYYLYLLKKNVKCSNNE